MKNYRWVITLIPLMMAAPIEAVTIYKKVNEDGVVIFSDEPDDDATPVDVSPSTENSVEIRHVPRGRGASARKKKKTPSFAYESFTINTPTGDEVIRSNNGSISVSVSAQPFLFPGHRVVYYMDGTPVASDTTESPETGTDNPNHPSGNASTELQGISNGQHTLTAAITDPEGQELIRTKPVTFNLLRATVGGK